MEEDGDPLPQPRGQEGAGEGPCPPTARGLSQEEGGDPPVWQRAIPEHGMPEQEEGNPPSQANEGEGDRPRAPMASGLSPEEGGNPPARQCMLPVHGMPEGEERSPSIQGAEDGAPPERCALPAHVTQGRGGGTIITQTPRGDPRSSVCPQGMACRDRDERGGQDPSPKGRKGRPPSRHTRPLCAA